MASSGTDGDDLADSVGSIEDPEGSKRYSYLYLTGLFVVIVAGLAVSVFTGIITPDIDVRATVTIGWIIEYTVAGLGLAFLLWTFANVANIVGMDFIAGIVRVAARIADNYELPDDVNGDSDEE